MELSFIKKVSLVLVWGHAYRYCTFITNILKLYLLFHFSFWNVLWLVYLLSELYRFYLVLFLNWLLCLLYELAWINLHFTFLLRYCMIESINGEFALCARLPCRLSLVSTSQFGIWRFSLFHCRTGPWESFTQKSSVLWPWWVQNGGWKEFWIG